MMSGTTTRWLLGALLVLVVAGAGVAYFLNPALPPQGTVACTMEAKLCPDGSYVGRTGPNCEFTACPDTAPAGNPPVVGEGEHCGGFIQNASVCEAGFHCQLKISMPDTGGTCVADSASGGGGGFAQYHSGIRGTVMLGPTCPVMRNPPDPQCADKHYATQISVARTTDPTHPIATVQSDSQGAFEVTLPPGDYIVSAAGGKTLPRCSSEGATVAPDAYTSITISCDTGIR